MANSTSQTIKKAAAKKPKKDFYAIYIVIVIVIVLVVSLALYMYAHSKTKMESHQNYQPLPSLIIDTNGQVVRLQITIQVNEKDRDWLEKNKNTINEIFIATGNDIDPASFRTNEGREAAQIRFRDDINQQMKVDKVKAILYNDMVIQEKVE